MSEDVDNRLHSISGLAAKEIERPNSTEHMYERSQRLALSALKTGFHLGGVIGTTRDELHERRRNLLTRVAR